MNSGWLTDCHSFLLLIRFHIRFSGEYDIGTTTTYLKSSDDDENLPKMCWPEDYVEHYIGKHDVMPTEEFFHYIVEKTNKSHLTTGLWK